MTEILAVTNQKGGVGKTTTAVNLAAALAEARQRVLLVDMDPQGNATMGCGVNKRDLAVSINEVLLGEAAVGHALCNVASAGMTLLPANGDLTGAETELIRCEGGQRRLLAALEQLGGAYDYVLIDCPPSLNMLTVNALTAATGVVIPVQCEYYALEGLSAILDTIDRVRHSTNPGLRVEGMLRTMFDGRNRLAAEVSAQLVAHFGQGVYETVIPRNVRLAEAPSYGLPVIAFDRSSRGAEGYLALGQEQLARTARRRAA